MLGWSDSGWNPGRCSPRRSLMEASRESPSAGRLQSEGSRKAGKKPPPRSRRRPRSQSPCEPYANRPSVDTIPGYHRTHHSQLSVAGSVPARPWRAFAECSRPSNTPPYLPASRLHYCSLAARDTRQLFSHSDVSLFHPVTLPSATQPLCAAHLHAQHLARGPW
jgi:hypothetical protein